MEFSFPCTANSQVSSLQKSFSICKVIESMNTLRHTLRFYATVNNMMLRCSKIDEFIKTFFFFLNCALAHTATECSWCLSIDNCQHKILFRIYIFVGPDHWQDHFLQCSGKHQSPINIDSSHVVRAALPKLQMEGFFSTEGESILTNNGHTGNFLVC